jgi:hypothetical protein
MRRAAVRRPRPSTHIACRVASARTGGPFRTGAEARRARVPAGAAPRAAISGRGGARGAVQAIGRRVSSVQGSGGSPGKGRGSSEAHPQSKPEKMRRQGLGRRSGPACRRAKGRRLGSPGGERTDAIRAHVATGHGIAGWRSRSLRHPVLSLIVTRQAEPLNFER